MPSKHYWRQSLTVFQALAILPNPLPHSEQNVRLKEQACGIALDIDVCNPLHAMLSYMTITVFQTLHLYRLPYIQYLRISRQVQWTTGSQHFQWWLYLKRELTWGGKHEARRFPYLVHWRLLIVSSSLCSASILVTSAFGKFYYHC